MSFAIFWMATGAQAQVTGPLKEMPGPWTVLEVRPVGPQSYCNRDEDCLQGQDCRAKSMLGGFRVCVPKEPVGDWDTFKTIINQQGNQEQCIIY